MKKMVVGVMALISLSSFAQVVEVSVPDGESVTKSHTASEGVKKIKEKVEQEYGVKCEGKSSYLFPDITKVVTYSASCQGETDLKLTIRSKFKAGEKGFEFAVQNYSIKIDFSENANSECKVNIDQVVYQKIRDKERFQRILERKGYLPVQGEETELNISADYMFADKVGGNKQLLSFSLYNGSEVILNTMSVVYEWNILRIDERLALVKFAKLFPECR